METSFLPVLACGVLSMVIGSIWYGPMFGKKWMGICKVNPEDVAARKKMQKEAAPLYLVQFLITLFQAFVLYRYMVSINSWGGFESNISHSLIIVFAFVIPTVAGSSMWNNDTSDVKWSRFLIQSGYQVVQFVMFALVFSFLA